MSWILHVYIYIYTYMCIDIHIIYIYIFIHIVCIYIYICIHCMCFIVLFISLLIPQTVRFGVLSWKTGTRRGGWVACGFQLGARGAGWHADRTQRAPGPDVETAEARHKSVGRGPPGPDADPDRERRDPTQRDRQRAPAPDAKSAEERQAPTQKPPRPDTQSVVEDWPGPTKTLAESAWARQKE